MDDLIPFLIVIAISIVGALSRKKKNKDYSNKPGMQPHISSGNDLLKWMENITDEEPEPFVRKAYYNPNPVVQQQPEIIEESNNDDIKNDLYKGFISPKEKQELMAQEGQRTVLEKVVDEDDLTKQGNKGILGEKRTNRTAFDLRQAVIFSEVLNRKYE